MLQITKRHIKPALGLVIRNQGIASAATKHAPDPDRTVRPFADIPKPWGIPLMGNFEDTKMLYGDSGAHKFFLNRHKDYGPIYRIKLYNKNSVILFDHRHAKDIIRSEGKLPNFPQINDLFVAQRIERQNNNAPLSFMERGGEGVSEIRRAIGKRSLVPKELLDLVPFMNKTAKDAIDFMFKNQEPDGSICLDVGLPRFFLEVSGYFLFGNSLGTFEPKSQDLINEFFSFPDTAVEVSLTHLWHVWPQIYVRNRSAWKEFLKVSKRGREIIRQFTDAAVVDYKKQIAAGEEPKGLLYPMLEQVSDRNNLQQAIDDLMLGGSGPGSTVALDCMWRLAQNQDIQEKLFQELKPVLPKGGNIDKDVLLKLRYLNAVFKESVRYTVPGGITARHSLEEDVTLFGYNVPAGTEIIYHQYACARNPDVFPDPDVFRPERWLEKSKTSDLMNSFHRAIPFGVGPRMCPGKRIVAIAVPLIYAHLIRNFKVTPAMEGDLGLVAKAMNFNDRKVYVKFEERPE